MKSVNYNYRINSSGIHSQRLNTTNQINNFLNKLGVIDKEGNINKSLGSVKIDQSSIKNKRSMLAVLRDKKTISILDLLNAAAKEKGHFFSSITGTDWNKRLEPKELELFLSMFIEWLCSYQRSYSDAEKELVVNWAVLSNSLYEISDLKLKRNIFMIFENKKINLILSSKHSIGTLLNLYKDNRYLINREPEIKTVFSLVPASLSNDLAQLEKRFQGLNDIGKDIVKQLRSGKSIDGDKAKKLSELIRQFKMKFKEIPYIKSHWNQIVNSDTEDIEVLTNGISELISRTITQSIEKLKPYVKEIQRLKKKLDNRLNNDGLDNYKKTIIKTTYTVYVTETQKNKEIDLNSIKKYSQIKKLLMHYENYRGLFNEMGCDISDLEESDQLLIQGLQQGREELQISKTEQLMTMLDEANDQVRKDLDNCLGAYRAGQASKELSEVIKVLEDNSAVKEYQRLQKDMQNRFGVSSSAINLEQLISNYQKDRQIIVTFSDGLETKFENSRQLAGLINKTLANNNISFEFDLNDLQQRVEKLLDHGQFTSNIFELFVQKETEQISVSQLELFAQLISGKDFLVDFCVQGEELFMIQPVNESDNLENKAEKDLADKVNSMLDEIEAILGID